MPKYTKKEFAKLIGVETKNLCNYIDRGKVVLSGDLIDDAIPVNQYFIEVRKAFNDKKNLKNKPATETAASTIETIQPAPEKTKLEAKTAEKKTSEVQTKFEYPPETPVSENYQLDSKIKKQSLEKSNLETAILKAKLHKLSGELIPTQLVKNLIAHHSKSITVAFRNGADNFLMQIAKKTGIERLEMSQLRIELIEIINVAVNDSIAESKKGLENIVLEYSKKKEVGEKA